MKSRPGSPGGSVPGPELLGLHGWRALATLPLLHSLLHALLHRFEFLLLLIVQHSFDFGGAVAADGLHFAVPVFARERLVLEERLHFLLTVFEDRLDLVLLVRAEIQCAGKVLQLRVRIHAAVAAAPVTLLLPIMGLGVNSGCGAKRQESAECKCCKFASHTPFSPC